MKKTLSILIGMALLFVLPTISEAGCCANPGAGVQYFCQNNIEQNTCCPKTGYGTNPSSYEECIANYFSQNSCELVEKCTIGCCCNPFKTNAQKGECNKESFYALNSLAGKTCQEFCMAQEPGKGPQPTSITPSQFNTIHTGPGACDTKIEGRSEDGNAIDSGWMQLYSPRNTSLFVINEDDCQSYTQSCPEGYHITGRIHTGPGDCKNTVEGTDYTGKGIDSGWLTLCTKDASAVLRIAQDDCSSKSFACPKGFNSSGKIHTGNGNCDGKERGVDHLQNKIESGWMMLCVNQSRSNTELKIVKEDCSTKSKLAQISQPENQGECEKVGEIKSEESHDVLCYEDQNGKYWYGCTNTRYGKVYNIRGPEGFDALCAGSINHPGSGWSSFIECDTDGIIEKTGNGEVATEGQTAHNSALLCIQNQGKEAWLACTSNEQVTDSQGNAFYCCGGKWQDKECQILQGTCPHSCMPNEDCMIRNGEYKSEYECPSKTSGYLQIELKQACCHISSEGENENIKDILKFTISTLEDEKTELPKEFEGLGILNWFNVIQIGRASAKFNSYDYELGTHQTLLSEAEAGRSLLPLKITYSDLVTSGEINGKGKDFLDSKYLRFEQEADDAYTRCVIRYSDQNYLEKCAREGLYAPVMVQGPLVDARTFEEQVIKKIANDPLADSIIVLDSKIRDETVTNEDVSKVMFLLAKKIDQNEGYDGAAELYNLVAEETPETEFGKESIARKQELETLGFKAKYMAKEFAIGMLGLDNLLPIGLPAKVKILRTIGKMPKAKAFMVKYSDKNKVSQWLFREIKIEAEHGEEAVDIVLRIQQGKATESEMRRLTELLGGAKTGIKKVDHSLAKSNAKHQLISSGIPEEETNQWFNILEKIERGEVLTEQEIKFFNSPVEKTSGKYLGIFPDMMFKLKGGNFANFVDEGNRLFDEGDIQGAFENYRKALGSHNPQERKLILMNMRRALVKTFEIDETDSVLALHLLPKGPLWKYDFDDLSDLAYMPKEYNLAIVRITRDIPVIDKNYYPSEIYEHCNGCQFAAIPPATSSTGINSLRIVEPEKLHELIEKETIVIDMETLDRAGYNVQMEVSSFIKNGQFHPDAKKRLLEKDLGKDILFLSEIVYKENGVTDAISFINNKYGFITMSDGHQTAAQVVHEILDREVLKLQDQIELNPLNVDLWKQKKILMNQRGFFYLAESFSTESIIKLLSAATDEDLRLLEQAYLNGNTNEMSSIMLRLGITESSYATEIAEKIFHSKGAFASLMIDKHNALNERIALLNQQISENPGALNLLEERLRVLEEKNEVLWKLGTGDQKWFNERERTIQAIKESVLEIKTNIDNQIADYPDSIPLLEKKAAFLKKYQYEYFTKEELNEVYRRMSEIRLNQLPKSIVDEAANPVLYRYANNLLIDPEDYERSLREQVASDPWIREGRILGKDTIRDLVEARVLFLKAQHPEIDLEYMIQDFESSYQNAFNYASIIPEFVHAVPDDEFTRVYIFRDAAPYLQSELIMDQVLGTTHRSTTLYVDTSFMNSGIGREMVAEIQHSPLDYQEAFEVAYRNNFEAAMRGTSSTFSRDVELTNAEKVFAYVQHTQVMQERKARFIDTGFGPTVPVYLQGLMRWKETGIETDSFAFYGRIGHGRSYDSNDHKAGLVEAFEKGVNPAVAGNERQFSEIGEPLLRIGSAEHNLNSYLHYLVLRDESVKRALITQSRFSYSDLLLDTRRTIQPSSIATFQSYVYSTKQGMNVLVKDGPEHTVQSDFVGHRIAKMMGANAPDSWVLETPEGKKVATRFLENYRDGTRQDLEQIAKDSPKDKIAQSFLSDLLVKNYDRVYFNIMYNKANSVDFALIDFGGSLASRARGGFKGFDSNVEDDIRLVALETPEGINVPYSIIIQDKENLEIAAQKLASIPDSDIDRIVDEAGFEDGIAVINKLENIIKKIESEAENYPAGSKEHTLRLDAIRTFRAMIEEGGENTYYKKTLKTRREKILELVHEGRIGDLGIGSS